MISRKQYDHIKAARQAAKGRGQSLLARKAELESELARVLDLIAEADEEEKLYKDELKTLVDEYERVNNR